MAPKEGKGKKRKKEYDDIDEEEEVKEEEEEEEEEQEEEDLPQESARLRFSSLSPPLSPQTLRVLEAMFGGEQQTSGADARPSAVCNRGKSRGKAEKEEWKKSKEVFNVRASPVQAAVIPLLLNYKDVVARAITGSGKTLAFLVPMAELLLRASSSSGKKARKVEWRGAVGGLVVAPTRELAQQIGRVALPLMSAHDISVTILTGGGGGGAAEEARRMEGMGLQVVIGTPGRLHDVLRRGCALDLKKVELLVLDEADRLLELGFEEDVKSIVQMLPKQRRTGLFSATQTEGVDRLAKAGMRNPVRVTVLQATESSKNVRATSEGVGGGGGATVPEGLQVYFTLTEPDATFDQLATFLRSNVSEGSLKGICYFMTCACVDFAATILPKLPGMSKLTFVHIHGRMKQAAREQALQTFSNSSRGGGGATIMLATDVAARGLDIPGVDWVIQADPPQDPAAFVHRIGRTARMGKKGSAIVYLHPSEETYINFLQQRKVPMVEREPETETVASLPTIRAMSIADRAVMDKATRAYVSYVRAYREHHCRYIFRLADLDLGKLATGFGLLQLPRMPELKSVDTSNFEAPRDIGGGKDGIGIEIDLIRYKDKGREKQRQLRLKQDLERASQRAGTPLEKGRSKNLNSKAKAVFNGKERGPKLNKSERKKRNAQDIEDISDEYRLLKKLKKGKITEDQYMEAMEL